MRFRLGAAGERHAPSQIFRERLPSPGLGRHVTCVWIQHVPCDATAYLHRTVPHGSIELVCSVGAVPNVVGPQTGPTAEVLAAGTSVVGVRFRPGAAAAVLGLPVSELADRVVRSDELWPGSATTLGERVAAAASLAEAAAVLEAEVHQRLAEEPGFDPIAEEAARWLLVGRSSGIGPLASYLGMSERQLRRRCEAAIGVPPKALHRMLRFQRFLALTRERDHSSGTLAVLAAEAGFADEAHLSREALRLAGRSPREIVREAEHNCLGAHDHAASYGPLLRERALVRADPAMR